MINKGRDPKPTVRKAYPLPIDELGNAWDREIKELGQQGFYASTIRSMINRRYKKEFTISQIRGRLTVMGVSTADYRRGTGSYAQKAAARVRSRILRLRGLKRDVNAYERALREGRGSSRGV